jgi:hypothetical protein
MIGAAGVAIKQIEQQLATLGLVLIENRDHCATFSNATHTLRITSEPHYPGLSISLRNEYGETFELGLLAHLLAPEYQAQAHAPSATNGPEMYDHTNMVRFLQDNRALVFEQPASYFAAYQEASKLRLAKIGMSGVI